MKTRLTILVGVLLTAAFFSQPLTGFADQVRALLVHACNKSEPSDPALRDFDASLQQVFGFKTHRLLGQNGGELRPNVPMTLPLARGISIAVVPRGTEDGAWNLDVTVQQGQKTLLTSKMKMTRGAPLFIRGPEMGEGLLVIVMFTK